MILIHPYTDIKISSIEYDSRDEEINAGFYINFATALTYSHRRNICYLSVITPYCVLDMNICTRQIDRGGFDILFAVGRRA